MQNKPFFGELLHAKKNNSQKKIQNNRELCLELTSYPALKVKQDLTSITPKTRTYIHTYIQPFPLGLHK